MPLIKDIKVGEIHRIWFEKSDGCFENKDKFAVCVWPCGFLFINSDDYGAKDNLVIPQNLYSNFLTQDSNLYYGKVFEKNPYGTCHSSSYLNSFHVDTVKDLLARLENFDEVENLPRVHAIRIVAELKKVYGVA